MATYDPPQPLWKRNVAGLLDFGLSTAVFAVLLSKAFGAKHTEIVTANGRADAWGLDTIPTLLLIALVIGYFVVLGRTGGTVFQRLFGMRRAT